MKKLINILALVFVTFIFALLTQIIGSVITFDLLASFNLTGEIEFFTTLVIRLIAIYVIYIKQDEMFKDTKVFYPKWQGVLDDSWKMIFVGGFDFALFTLLLVILPGWFVYISSDFPYGASILASRMEGVSKALDFIGVVALGPITEELLFRGFLFEKLRVFIRPRAAAIISAILFASFHSGGVQTTGALISGVLYAVVYFYRENLVDAIIVHATNNLLASLAGLNLIFYILTVTLVAFSVFAGFMILYKMVRKSVKIF